MTRHTCFWNRCGWRSDRLKLEDEGCLHEAVSACALESSRGVRAWDGPGLGPTAEAWWDPAHCPVGRSDFFECEPGTSSGLRNLLDWNNIFNSLLSMTPPPELKIVP